MNKTVTYITATEHEAEQRIDNFLFKKFKNVPKSMLYRIIRKGELRVNKKRVKAEYRLQPDDVIRIPPMRIEKSTEKKAIPPYWKEFIANAVLFEDDELMVINKPAGIAAHAGTGDDFGMIEVIRETFSYQPYLELAHRIDKETSGCLIIAKSRPALLALHQEIQGSEFIKKYLLVCHGVWPRDLKQVSMNLLRGKISEDMRGMKAHEEGKLSETSFQRKKQQGLFSLVEATLHTGKMHQIRVHASEMGYPIVGDKKYGDWEKDKISSKSKSLRHMYLHAASVEFALDLGSRKRYHVQAPLPDYFNLLLGR